MGKHLKTTEWCWSERQQHKNPERCYLGKHSPWYDKKVSDSKKTGAGGSELTELDDTVLDILGRESANLEPVKVEDTPIVFESEEVVCTTPETEGEII